MTTHTHRKFRRKLLASSFLLMLPLALAGCQTASSAYQEDKVNAVMEQAVANAEQRGNTAQSLSILEQMYKRNSGDPQTALKYAHALRQAGYYSRGALVLGPFAKDPNQNDIEILTEYASIQAAAGEYIDAESAARKAVLVAPDSGKAYHLLGIALDAQGHHEQAQVAFEKGLEHWEGDPSPILNNIGLNLAAQGFLDEASETLRKALATAPNRMEIERNLRIVQALQYQPPVKGTRLVPIPPRKPTDPVAVKEAAPAEKPVGKTEAVEAAPVSTVTVEAVEPADEDEAQTEETTKGSIEEPPAAEETTAAEPVRTPNGANE